jgi:hypothetical protein
LLLLLLLLLRLLLLLLLRLRLLLLLLLSVILSEAKDPSTRPNLRVAHKQFYPRLLPPPVQIPLPDNPQPSQRQRLIDL